MCGMSFDFFCAIGISNLAISLNDDFFVVKRSVTQDLYSDSSLLIPILHEAA
jgi:hypothetical protein